MTLDLDIPAARACAPAIADLGARVVAGVTRVPTAPSGPRWAASEALLALIDNARRALGVLGADIGSAAHRIGAAVDDYEDADGRAVRRLRDALWR